MKHCACNVFVTSQSVIHCTTFSVSSRSAIKINAKMWTFFWSFFAVFLILQSTAEHHTNKKEEEDDMAFTNTHVHGVSSLQSDVRQRQKQLANTLQHFMDEFKDLYDMMEHLKNGDHGDSTEEHHNKEDSHDMPRNNGQHSNHLGGHNTHARDEHRDQTERHNLHRDTSTRADKNEEPEAHMTKRSSFEESHEDHVVNPETPDSEDEEDEEVGHSGEGEHSGEHEGPTEKGAHLNHGENHGKEKEREEMHKIEQMGKKAHKKSGHGDSHVNRKETEEMHEVEQIEKEAHKKDRHRDNHGGKKETEEMHEVEQMETKAHKKGNKDNHVDMTTDIHHIDHSKEKESEQRHEVDEIEHREHLKSSNNHSKEDNEDSEHSGEVEEKEHFDHAIDEDIPFNGFHGGYETDHSNERYIDTTHDNEYDDDDDDDLHGHSEEHSFSHERKRHHSDPHDDVAHHDSNTDVEPFPHDKKIHDRDTHHHDDALHHDSNSHVGSSSHDKKIHDRVTHHHGDAAHHDRNSHVNPSSRERRMLHRDTRHHEDTARQDSSNHVESHHQTLRQHRHTRHDDNDDDDLHHDHSSSHKKRHMNNRRVNDHVTHHDSSGHVDSSRHRRKRHHMDTRNNDGGDDLHHDRNGHVGSHEKKRHHKDTTGGNNDDWHHDRNGHVNSHELEGKRHRLATRDDDVHHDGAKEGIHRNTQSHLDSSKHKRSHGMSSHEGDDSHHGSDSSAHKKETNHILNDNNHDADTESHNYGNDNHHRSNGHLKASTLVDVEYHRPKSSRRDSNNHKNFHVPSRQNAHPQLQRHHMNKDREEPHNLHQHHRTRREMASSDDDIFIDEDKNSINNKKRSVPVVLTNDYEILSDDGDAGAIEDERFDGRAKKKYKRTRKIRGQLNIPYDMQVEELIAGMKQFSQSEPDCGPVANLAFVYDKNNCRLCQCLEGKLQCEAKPKTCRTDQEDNMCSFINGEFVNEGTAHYDGCNHCICRKREWMCTRLRCQTAHYDYVNYASLPERTSGIERPIDTCMECDREPVTPVCGPDWRTYRSLCHARFCGNYDIDEIEQGPCSKTNPCHRAECTGDDEVCVPFPRGPCLSAKTRDGHPVECKQYQCVSKKKECSDDTLPGEVVCGEDGQTYPSECHLVKKSVGFAYRGPCRSSCMTGNTQVCGTDGVTYQSDCHANLLNRHVDYPGACENMVAKPEVVNAENGSFIYVRRRCSKVQEMARCLYPSCKTTVVPEGSCCPVCGAAVSIRVDRAIASDLLDLPILKPSMEFTSLKTIQSFIRRIQDPQNLRKCRMTVDFTDRNDLSVLFTPRQPGYIQFCQKAAQDTMEYVNSHANSSVPIEAILASAVAVEQATTTSSQPTRVKRNVNLDLVRIRRAAHHEHHPYNSSSVDVTPRLGLVLSFCVYFSLHWFIGYYVF